MQSAGAQGRGRLGPAPVQEQRLVVVGSKRMASFDDVSKALVIYDRQIDVHDGEPTLSAGKGYKVPYDDDEPLRIECRAFIDAMRSRRAPLSDGPSGLRVLRVLEAASESLGSGGSPVPLGEEVPTSTEGMLSSTPQP